MTIELLMQRVAEYLEENYQNKKKFKIKREQGKKTEYLKGLALPEPELHFRSGK